MYSHETFPLLRLRVVADADPTAIGRVIERFQNLNVVPRRVSAEFATDDRLHIEVDVFGLTEEQISFVTRKIGQAVSIHQAHWHPSKSCTPSPKVAQFRTSRSGSALNEMSEATAMESSWHDKPCTTANRTFSSECL